MEVLDLILSHYEFNCLVSVVSLTQQERTILGLVGDEEEWVSVEGDFTVEWDDETPLVVLNSVYFVNNNKYLAIPEELKMQLEENIEENGNVLEWATDRLAAEADSYEYDVTYDR